MSRDGGTAVAITAATAAASAVSYLILSATTKKEKRGLDLFEKSLKKIDIDGEETKIDRREQLLEAKNSPGPSESKESDYEESLRMVLSTETGATAEGGDTVYELIDRREILGSQSFVSKDDEDSDSDISYESDSRMSFHQDSLKDLLSSDRFLEVALDPDTVNDDINPDNVNHPCIYLDYNGTTPVDRRVFAAMIPYLTLHFGNPSSSHAYGAMPKRAISKARRSILELLQPGRSDDFDERDLQDSIVFTGCGTEADNMAIHLAINSTTNIIQIKKHIVTTNVEHPAIAECLKVLEAKGEIDVTYVPVNEEGIVSAREVIKAIRNETVLVTIMLANNESGAIQPVKEIAPYCRQHGILFHTDAAQAVGKVSVTLDEKGITDVDMVTIVGHKFGAPKGIACLYIRPGCLEENGRKEPKSSGYGSSGILLLGGGQECGRRAGTENVPYIAGMGNAADILTAYTSKRKYRRWKRNASKMKTMRTRLLFKFKEAFQDVDADIVRENGPKNPSKRLPNTLSVGFKNVHSGELLNKIQGTVACSAGSACHASGGKVSGVLLAMKVPMEYARGTLRLSVGPGTTLDDIDKAAQIIIDEIKRQLNL